MTRQLKNFSLVAGVAGLLSGCALFGPARPVEEPATCTVCKNNTYVELLYAPGALPKGSKMRVIEPGMVSRDPRTNHLVGLDTLGARRVAVCNACGLIVGTDETAVSLKAQPR
jgi:hypothetical protein